VISWTISANDYDPGSADLLLACSHFKCSKLFHRYYQIPEQLDDAMPKARITLFLAKSTIARLIIEPGSLPAF
jgi:hypothetical protein